MVKKILGLLVLLSPVLSHAASSAAASSGAFLAKITPYLQLIMHTSDYLDDSLYFNGTDHERQDLLSYAKMVRDYSPDKLYFLASFLKFIHKSQPTFSEVYGAVLRHRVVDVDGIHMTYNFAQKYLSLGSMRDAVRQLSMDAHAHVLNNMFSMAGKPCLTMKHEIKELLGDILIRFIRLEKKSIRMALHCFKDRQEVKKALFQAALCGVRLEIVVDKGFGGNLQKFGLPYKEAYYIDSSMHNSYVLFEQNLDDLPVVVNGASVFADSSESSFHAPYITRNEKVYESRSRSFAQLFARAGQLIQPKAFLDDNILPVDQYQKSAPLVVPSEVKMLIDILDMIRYQHTCSPVMVESFDDSCKRQRRE